MNKTTKTLSLTVAMFAIVGMVGVFSNSQVFADPAPEGTKKVYQFNIIARPNPYNGNCGEGDRIFVEAGAKGLNHAHINIEEAGDREGRPRQVGPREGPPRQGGPREGRPTKSRPR